MAASSASPALPWTSPRTRAVGAGSSEPGKARRRDSGDNATRSPKPKAQSLGLIAKQVSDRLKGLHVIADDFDDHHNWYREQDAPRTPDPTPEQETAEHRDLIHR